MARLLGCPPGGGRGVGPRRDPSPPKGGMPGVPATDGCAPGAPYRGKGDRAESEKKHIHQLEGGLMEEKSFFHPKHWYTHSQ